MRHPRHRRASIDDRECAERRLTTVAIHQAEDGVGRERLNSSIANNERTTVINPFNANTYYNWDSSGSRKAVALRRPREHKKRKGRDAKSTNLSVFFFAPFVLVLRFLCSLSSSST